MLFILGVLLGFISSGAWANDATTAINFSATENKQTQDAALELLEKAQHLKTIYAVEAAQLNAQTKEVNVNCFGAQTKDNVAADSKKGLNLKFGQAHKFMIFISFSMPKSALHALYRQAAAQQVPLILRGLKNNSFKETAEYLRELNIAVQIDPQLFAQYQVTAVPTIVHLTTDGFNSLSGNVSFEFAKMKLLEKR